MCLNLSAPPTVNSRGDTLSNKDSSTVTGFQSNLMGFNGPQLNLTPAQRGEMLYNWLTAGGAPKPLDPSKTFKEAQDFAPTKEKAAAGAGIGGMFGAGLLVGDLVPKTKDLNPASPMQPGVPYSVPPMAKPGAR